MSFILSFSGFFSRFNILDAENKEISSGLAEACVDSAIVKIASDWSYAPIVGGESVPVGANNCNIVSVQISGASEEIIKTQAGMGIMEFHRPKE